MVATRRSLWFRRTAPAAGAAVVLILFGGCSSSSDDDASGGSGSSADMAAPAEAAAPQKAADAGGDAAEVASLDTGSADSPAESPVEAQKVISTGNVQLRSDDVGQTVFDVRKVVDVHRGTISEDDTETDDDGDALRSRMVLRIPTADFDDAMSELEKVATLVSSKRQSADVTTQVLDTDVRVEAQQRSIDRIQVLFDHATSIKDVVSIEGELSRRQADLASLEAQQRYLADQTSLSTITLAVERTPDKAKPKPEHHDAAGFLSGLSDGWGALETFLVGASTVAGVLLPWLLLALVLAVPGWPLLRRLRHREPAAAPTP
jgi:Domain of unknown function (DUF4349)